MKAQNNTNRPLSAGSWNWRKDSDSEWKTVKVEDSPFSGRFCRELKMGGCLNMGFGKWSGEWKRA